MVFAISGQANPCGNAAGGDSVASTGNTEAYVELGIMNIKEGKWDNFLPAVQHNIINSRNEPGNMAFSLYQPENGKPQALWFEKFENKAAHKKHKEQPYFKVAMKAIEESLEGEIISILLKEVEEIPSTIPVFAAEPATTRNIIVLFDVKPERRQDFIKAIAEVSPHSRQAMGNLGFNIYQYADDPNKFALLEGWESEAAHEAHLAQGYSKKLNAALDGLFVTNPMDARWLVKDISQ